MRNVVNFREIIKELSQNGLKIIDKTALHYHIRNFNYNTFIYCYSEPFYREDKKYDLDASSDQIINLFKFDRDMANHILRFILVIEKIMNTNVTYGIINGYNIKDKCLFKLNSAFIEQKILVNIRDIFPKMNYHSLVSKLLKFLPSNKTTMVFRDKNSWEEIYRWRSCPLDLMCLTWSFATTLSLFISLEDRIRKQIITNFGINEKHINGFIEFMKSILHLRNMISHNNVIFNHIPICFDNSSVLNMYYELFNKSIKHINLINLMELIEYFSHSKTLVSNTQYYFKKMKIESKFKEKIGLFNV